MRGQNCGQSLDTDNITNVCAATLGCTSTLKAFSGRYAYYEVVDGAVVYFSWNPMSQRYPLAVLEGADPMTFIAINKSQGKNASQVFKKSLPITHADSTNFALWSGGYVADATQVFYGRTRLEGAELATFERLRNGWSRDASNIYLGSKRLDVRDRTRCDAVLWWPATS